VHKNYYEILGVSKESTIDDIKKAYRTLSKKYHPDVNPTDGEKFKDIAEAYSVLSDDQKRYQYDNPRMDPFGGGVDMDEFLRNMGFGGNPFSNGGGQFNRRQPKAPDTIINIAISPIESYDGGKKEITYNIQDVCDTCNGGCGDKKICETCGGNGSFRRQVNNGVFASIVEQPCPTCNATGYQIINPCHGCGGKGSKSKIETITVDIPRSVDNGDFLRVAKRGNYHNGHGRGDLILKIIMEPKDDFEKIGMDLIFNKRMSVVDFLIQDKIIIPHPDGDISIVKPNNIDTDKPLRLRGKGYKTPQGNGNMYLKIVVFYDEQQFKDKLNELKEVLSN
jgi:molecular chaperone DnaJ